MKLMGWVNVAGCLILGLGVVVGVWQWEWIVTGPTGEESGSTILRNLGFVAGGFIAIWIAIWRSIVADRQAQASQRQAMASLNQVEVSRLSLLNERYQKGAEMLGHRLPSVRWGGIYALRHLAEDVPEQYCIPIMALLSAFVDNPHTPEMMVEDNLGDVEFAKIVIKILNRGSNSR